MWKSFLFFFPTIIWVYWGGKRGRNPNPLLLKSGYYSHIHALKKQTKAIVENKTVFTFIPCNFSIFLILWGKTLVLRQLFTMNFELVCHSEAHSLIRIREFVSWCGKELEKKRLLDKNHPNRNRDTLNKISHVTEIILMPWRQCCRSGIRSNFTPRSRILQIRDDFFSGSRIRHTFRNYPFARYFFKLVCCPICTRCYNYKHRFSFTPLFLWRIRK
jgi:hypothetical protein